MALEIQSADSFALHAEAHDLHVQGKFSEALDKYEAAIALTPDEPNTLRDYGACLGAVGHYEEAVRVLKMAVAYAPGDARAHCDLAIAFGYLGHFREQKRHYDRALAISPNTPKLLWNMALWYLLHRDYEPGWDLYRWGRLAGRKIRTLKPEWDGSVICDGKTLFVWSEQGFGDTIQMVRFLKDLRERVGPKVRIVLEVQHDLVRLLTCAGTTGIAPSPRLKSWAEVEGVLRTGEEQDRVAGLPSPLLLSREGAWPPSPQFWGDHIGVAGWVDEVIAENDMGSIPFEDGEYEHVSLMSLAHRLGLCDEAKFWTGPYLGIAGRDTHATSSPDRTGGDAHAKSRSDPPAPNNGGVSETSPQPSPWKGEGARTQPQQPLERKGESTDPWPLPEGKGVRVGFCWKGNPAHANDRQRSLPDGAFDSLLTIPGVDAVSLALGEANAREFRDWYDTAITVASLDLVVTVDTAVAHLAGAMGKPVWLLLQYVPDWRWSLGRDTTPWYPSMTIDRQPRPGDWASVLEVVRCHLECEVEARRKPWHMTAQVDTSPQPSPWKGEGDYTGASPTIVTVEPVVNRVGWREPATVSNADRLPLP